MAESDKKKESILGLGLPENTNDPNAWRPSKGATHESAEAEVREAASKANTASGAMEHPKREADAAAWRPSKVNEQRLRSLSPTRGRKLFAISPRTRLLFRAALFAGGAYFLVRVWLMPQAGELHVALAIAAAAMVLLLVSAIVGASRRRRAKRGDEKSILRL